MSSVHRHRRLAELVAEVARSGRIGRPVFARWTETLAGDALSPAEATSAALAAVARWFGDAPSHAYRPRDDESVESTVACRWPGGQSALISAGPARPGARPGVDLALVGSTGAVYHRGPCAREFD